MVFYDTGQRRKLYVRAIVIAAVLVVSLAVVHVFRVLTTPIAMPVAQATAATTTIPDKVVALTFDDGPSGRSTERIMSVLEQYHVPATFFFIGENMIDHPDIVRDVYARGFEIGNHSYTHSHDIHTSQERTVWELNATNKILEQTIGHRSVLFRPPFLADIENEEREILAPGATATPDSVKWVNALGYTVVNSRVDSNDWEADSTDQIVWDVLGSLSDGHIILMHDGGHHDLSLTVEALPQVIEALQKAGYTFVTAGQLAGMSRTETMPQASPGVGLEAVEFTAFSYTMYALNTFVPVVLLLALVFSMGRLIVLLGLAWRNRKAPALRAWRGGVSVLIPAWNEEANIRATIESVLLSSHPNIEVIVIDDGSIDQTPHIVREIAQVSDRKVSLIRTENNGKASALNTGLAHASYDVVVAIDGDTVVHDHAISWLAAHFNDSQVGAVSGKVCAITTNLIGRFQDIEYVVGQNIEKRGFGYINAINVIPGALGAWRTRDLRRAGGYDLDTFVEDQDMTLAIHMLGQTVRYEPRALAYTEVPSTVRGFMRQRMRWMLGSIQCLWKYRGAFFSLRQSSVGWTILPHNLVFIVLLPLMWPVIDATAVLLILSQSWSILLGSYLAYVIFDLVYSIVGLAGDARKWRLLALVPFQRLFYRFTLSLIVFYSIMKAVEGTRAFWYKLDRTGTAQQLYGYAHSTFPTQVVTTQPVNPSP